MPRNRLVDDDASIAESRRQPLALDREALQTIAGVRACAAAAVRIARSTAADRARRLLRSRAGLPVGSAGLLVIGTNARLRKRTASCGESRRS